MIKNPFKTQNSIMVNEYDELFLRAVTTRDLPNRLIMAIYMKINRKIYNVIQGV